MSSSATGHQQQNNIIVFTSQGCKFCSKAKNLLSKHSLPFTALDVEFFPDRYKKAAEYTKVGTVPLIFVGNDFKGGSSDLEELFGKLKNPKEEIFENNNNNEKPLSSDADFSFLQLPLSEAEKKAEKREKESDFMASNGFKDLTFVEPASKVTFTYTELLHYLRYDPSTCVPLENKGIIFKTYKVTRGRNIVEAIEKFLQSKNINTTDSQQLARKLATVLACPRVQMIYDADTQVSFSRSSSAASTSSSASALITDDKLFRFTADALENGDFGSGKFILNASRPVSSFQKEDDPPLDFTSTTAATSSSSSPLPLLTPQQAVSLSRALWKVQDELCTEFKSPKDDLVDYGALYRRMDSTNKSKSNNFTNNKNWIKFKQMSSFLQLVDLSQMSDAEKIAFGVNLYNTAVYCGFFEFFVPWSNMQKLSFFGGIGFLIKDNNFFSLNDLENGFLRGNRKGVTDFFSCPISSNDPRKELRVKNVDYRIHCGLNCGASSCPPVKLFSTENLDEELELATKSFIQSSSSYNPETNKITTSQILKWYKEDFDRPNAADGGHTVQDVILKYLYTGDEEKKKEILSSSKNGGKSSNIGLEYSEYDWGFNAKKE